jgi:dihydropteroate synthase
MAGIWRISGRDIDTSRRGPVMGIVNVTPDSFSDGGQFLDAASAIDCGIRLAAEGADILDIGGESTRPGAQPVDADEEMRRVLPVIRALRDKTDVLISIDTMKASVALAAVDAGAHIINDVTGLSGDPDMLHVAAGCDAGLVVMHMKGTPRTMQQHPEYRDVVAEVRDYFSARLAALEEANIDLHRVALDPGFGFGKTIEHNLALLRALPGLRVRERPLLIGVSRKSMLGRIIGSETMDDRNWPTVALTSFAREQGAGIVRVHDVRPNAEAMRMTEAILFPSKHTTL